MKNKLLFVICIFALIIAGWLFTHHAQKNARQSSSTNTMSAAEPDLVGAAEKTRVNSNITARFSHGNSPADTDYIHRVKADPQYDWKQPINFYGRVVDENDAAVVGASVHFTWNNISVKGTADADTTSDNNGFFSLTDKRGKRLYVDVGKSGYYSSGDSRGAAFEYANPFDGLFHPDSMNPVVFHLRKKGEGAALIHGDQLFGFRTNGPVQYLDLLQGKNTLNPPGDLAAQVFREPRNSEAKYNWSAVISVPEGGILETNEEFMFEAPADGYQPSIVIQATTNDLHWSAVAKTRFYFKSRNGRIYGRAEATIYSQYQKAAAIDLNYYVNPDGSRNLEPK